MNEYETKIQYSKKIWIIQLCQSIEASIAFKKAAYILQGVAKAGIIECIEKHQCTEIGGRSDGNILFVHSDGVDIDYQNNDIYELIVSKTMELVNKRVENRRKEILLDYVF